MPAPESDFDPGALVTARGLPQLGVFPAPVRLVNYMDYDYRTPMGRRVGRLEKRLRFHQFQYFGGMCPELMFGCAVADLGFAGVAFAYVYRPPTGGMRRYSFRVPLARGVTSSPSPLAGASSLATRGAFVEMAATESPRGRRLRVRLAAGLAIDAAYVEDDPPFEPMALCTRAGASGWVYAQKTAGVALAGSVRSDLGAWDLAAIDAHAHHDWSAGFMRRETSWRWATLSGRTAAGDRVGLNVSCGVNETSFTENCCWLNGRLVKVDLVALEFDRDDAAAPWTIRSRDGVVDLRFHPARCHAERLNLLLAATNFRHFLGRFEGTIQDGGRAHAIRDVPGLAEDHYAKW